MATAQKYISRKQASQDITGAKKPQVLTGALKSCYILPEYVKDNNGGAFLHVNGLKPSFLVSNSASLKN